jgi:hypothetical protein
MGEQVCQKIATAGSDLEIATAGSDLEMTVLLPAEIATAGSDLEMTVLFPTKKFQQRGQILNCQFYFC